MWPFLRIFVIDCMFAISNITPIVFYFQMQRRNYLSIVITAIIIGGFVGGSHTLVPEIFAQNTTTDSGGSATPLKTLRLGYYPNINHAQAVIGVGRGDFQKALGPDVKLETVIFNAGPSAIEALLANRIDATYVGSNPAINGYVVSDGEGLRIVAGSASAGAVFVVRNDSGIQSPKDIGGKKFASPQLGNTQDIALRKYIQDNGFKTTENGGNVTVVPIANPDILTLFLKKEIDGAWVPEPWGARLIKEGNGRIFLDERDLWPNGKFVTANIAVSTDYLKNNPEIIKQLLVGHLEETDWINNNREKATQNLNIALKKITGKTIPEDELIDAFSRLDFTYDPISESLLRQADNAYDLGYFANATSTKPDLSGIYDLTILNSILEENKQTKIE